MVPESCFNSRCFAAHNRVILLTLHGFPSVNCNCGYLLGDYNRNRPTNTVAND